jgi:hypothetical protein
VEELLTRVWDMLIGREHGPLAFRIVIQPMVAAFLAIHAGLRDAREGRGAYGWTVVTDPAHRRELLSQGRRDIGRLFAAAVTIDLIYEVVVFRWIYPTQALIVAATLAVPPYFLIRGVANRLARRCINSGRQGRRSGQPH